jgi:hypothetical protein
MLARFKNLTSSDKMDEGAFTVMVLMAAQHMANGYVKAKWLSRVSSFPCLLHLR